MKYILLFIYRILNIIVSILSIIILIPTYPFWSLFGYLFIGSDYFKLDPEEEIQKFWNITHYPLYKLYELINNIDNIKFNFNKFLNNKFWK